MEALLAIRTRWLVLAMVVAVAGVAALAIWDEEVRTHDALGELGSDEVAVADAVARVRRDALPALDEPEHRVILLAHGAATRVDGTPVAIPGLREAIDRGESVVRIDRDVAASLGLPHRTAMLGISEGRDVAIATSAASLRDRSTGRVRRIAWTIALAASLVGLFGGLALARQRRQLELARELALRAKDAELDRLARAATMAAIGSGVAHELSTPLGVIVGRAEQLAARANGDERIAKAARTILEQVDHVDRVVRGLLGLARGAPIALVPVAPGALVREAAELVDHRFARANVKLDVQVAGELPEVRCEPLLFKHALVNLLLNACDASPAGASVRLDVRASDGELAFVVTDDGEGIAPADAARALEPFYTTKPQGTGLGLAIAREIASSHRGALAIGPREPHGTRASITVPLEVVS